MGQYSELTTAVQRIANLLPYSIIEQLVANLEDIDNINHRTSRIHIMNSIVKPEVRVLIAELLDVWSADYPHLRGDVLSLALESASTAVEYQRKIRTIDVVWTGPVIHEVNLRHTENVLLELIHSAKHHLHIVSFAVYKAQLITDALLQALGRGVSVSIYLEVAEHGETRKTSYDTKKALGDKLAQKARVYSWALSQRRASRDNKHGVLHAKTAIADGERFFVTSANLTDYAMSLNIELGVLVRDRDSAQKIENQLRLLIEHNIFVLI